MKKLTLKDRYFLSMYARRLPCTIALRFSIDNFFNQIEITSEEVKKFEVKINPKTLEFECNDNEHTTEFKEFPEEVLKSMKSYIKMFDHEKNKTNEMVQRTFEYFRKIL